MLLTSLHRWPRKNFSVLAKEMSEANCLRHLFHINTVTINQKVIRVIGNHRHIHFDDILFNCLYNYLLIGVKEYVM